MPGTRLVRSGTGGFVRFDSAGRLVETGPGLVPEEAAHALAGKGVSEVLPDILDMALGIDGEEAAELASAWRHGRPAEVSRGGRRYLLTSAPARDGRLCVLSDVTASRETAERAPLEDDLLREILDSCPANIGMARLDSGEIIYRTPAWRKLFGYRRLAREQYANPDDRAEFLTRLLPTGELDDFHVLCRRDDGSLFPGVVSARVIEYGGDEVAVCAVTDVSDTVAQKAAAEQATERLRDAIDSLDQGFAMYDAEGRLAMFNRKYLSLNAHIPGVLQQGVPYTEVLEKALGSGMLGPEEYAQVRALAEPDADDSDAPRRFDFRHADGTWYSISRTRTSEGGFVITRRDITARKRREAEERELDAVMRRVLDACPVSLVMTRASDGTILFQSEYAKERFGAFDNIVDYWVDPEQRKRWVKDINRLGRIDGREVDVKRPDGSQVRVALSGRLSTFRGEPVIVSHAFDLTERVAMEAELTRQRETLYQSEKLSALGELLAGVAHELNNPLSVVVGHALMLEEEATDPDMKARIGKIGTAAERCARIVKTFLAMARQRPARMERVTVSEVLETALDITAYSLRNAGVEVSTRLEADLCEVRADPDQLVQVFTNILLNAEHALADQEDEKVVTIAARRDHATNEIVVKIKDNGPGIPEAIRSRIFEPFFTTKAVNHGTGIGLAFCHRVIEDHAGRIYVRSQPGRGASFFVRLPLAAERAEQPGCCDGDQPGGRAARILVIEDEPDVAGLIAEILESDGHCVLPASDGAEGLALIEEHPIDMILSDLAMPGIDGRGVFERLRRDHPQLAQRIAFVTGDTVSPGAQAFLRHAGRPYLEKPVVPRDLRALIGRLAAAPWPEIETAEAEENVQ